MEIRNNLANLDIIDHGNNIMNLVAFLVKHDAADYVDGKLYLKKLDDKASDKEKTKKEK